MPWRKTSTIITGAAIGHVLEWFDYAVYAYFASVISQVIFGSSSSSAFFLTFLSYGIGLAFRPLGSIFFAHLGDKRGRKYSLLITFWIMGLGTLLTGLVPSYASLGVFAGVLITLFRVLQGFAAGGEWGGVGSYLVELGGSDRRAFYSSVQQIFILASVLIADLTGLFITFSFPHSFVYSVGWRIPFILSGVILIPVAYLLRAGLPETDPFVEVKEKKETVNVPLAKVFVKEKRAMVLQLVGMLFTPVTFYTVLTYLPSYVLRETHLPSTAGFVMVAVGSVVTIALIPVWAYLSDHYKNRKVFFLVASIGGAILSYPLFLLMSTGSFALAIVGIIIFQAVLSTYNATINVFIAESFPTNDRYSGFVPYNIVTAYAGGFAPTIAQILIHVTKNPLSPSYYMIVACVASAVAIFFMKDAARLAKLPETESIYYSDILERDKK